MRRALPLILFALGLVALGVAATVMLVPKAGQVATSSVGGPFTLTDQDGRRVTERDFAGATHLVFFGFTHCPDVCPTTLQQIGDVLQALGPKGKDTKALFIAVDPERDTPEALKTYLASFDPRIVGLTGSQEEVNAAVKAYRAYVRKVPTKGDDYTMEHTALVYIMDGRNRFVNALNLTKPADQTAAELAKAL
ncbi:MULTISPECIES: SCO family protein [unclassified Methylobacterium]|uniref:SCO family protein n=1 Tax=unclassified Methylobacterium TaxID=2615210 RepID=UPI00070012ED|nr:MULTISPECIES: SCO family protein [unclassified Methylobacterium]KQO50892.1 copper-binding protein [Methylobacterium sp. Leaf86]KQO91547.1 copper-binding protein [Methylobacterium sp. Leaf91]MBO1022496.1 SCO family protein [Methylobacterium sp. SD274]